MYNKNIFKYNLDDIRGYPLVMIMDYWSSLWNLHEFSLLFLHIFLSLLFLILNLFFRCHSFDFFSFNLVSYSLGISFDTLVLCLFFLFLSNFDSLAWLIALWLDSRWQSQCSNVVDQMKNCLNDVAMCFERCIRVRRWRNSYLGS